MTGEAKKCPQCGAKLAGDIAGGHCPGCLVLLALAPAAAESAPAQIGDRIGSYLLVEKLGEGGCGLVFKAEQEGPVRREVALKVIKPGMDTPQIIARFAAERQTLARLEHPHIAKIFEAGATGAGRPFFVMELVRGSRITHYCDARQLHPRERLELFAQVCQAVQHAHEKGIIHRDLKPSNILVADEGGRATPKIIDFGIAKSLAAPFGEQTALTAGQQFVGTPAYMSPEQAGLGGAEVDTRSDIYSLGVLLYELLTGAPPFAAEEWDHFAPDQIARLIREKEPLRPSDKLTRLTPPQLAAVAGRRQIEPPQLPRLLRGELDWIVMKCLEKERSRRYATAASLAEDLQRHLRDEPVAARPSGQWYRLKKMARRHRLAFSAAGAVLAALMLGFGFSTAAYFREKAARQRAVLAETQQRQLRQQAEAARETALQQARQKIEVVKLFRDLLQGAGAAAAGRDAEKYRASLDRTAAELEGKLNNQPEVKAEIMAVIAETYRQLGDYPAMEKTDRAALQLAREHFDQSRLTAKILGQLAEAVRHQGQTNEANQLTQEAASLENKLAAEKR